jgi:hypothetical protein
MGLRSAAWPAQTPVSALLRCPAVMVSTGQIPWPSPDTSRDRHRAGFTTAPGQILMALDTPGRQSIPVGASCRVKHDLSNPSPSVSVWRLL